MTVQTPPIKAAVDTELSSMLSESYMDYAMSVLLGRALPSVLDGLKPVQRRVIWTALDMGLFPSKPPQKSVKLVGVCLGSYHPHGDASVYDASVRLAQSWSVNAELIDGQGNMGSVNGDGPAAYRYTEMRLSRYAHEILAADVGKDCVPFTPNYDGTGREPMVLPAAIPQLLVNGASGIGVAYATNVPPCNLVEVCAAAELLITKGDASEETIALMCLPDLPTGGVLCSSSGAGAAMASGSGSVRVRAKVEHEATKSGDRLVIREVPYMVSVEDLVNSIVEAVRGGKLKGIRDVRNETGKKGIRAVVELERGFDAGSVENALYKHTKCESTLKIALVAYKGSEFSQYSAKGILTEWIAFRRATVRSVLAYEVGQIYARLHIVEGLIRALSMIDKVIAIIRKAADPSAELQSSLGFSAIQAEAILETKLRRLAKLEVAALQAEEAKLGVSLGEKEAILDDPKLLDGTIVAGLRAASAKFGWERRTFLAEIDTSITVEDTLPDETFLIVTTNGGFIKRVRHEQSAQLKGGKGMSVGKVRDGDFVSRAFHAGTKDHLLFFTNTGRVFDLKAWEVPEAKLDSFGKPMGGICQLAEGERIVQLLNLTNAQFEDPEAFLMFGTRKGLVKKTPMPEYSNIRKTGLIALKVRDDDSLLNVVYVDASIQDVFMAHTWGKGITFPHSDVRPVGRDTFGMMGMDFDSENGCEACAFEAVPGWEGYDVITVASDGNGKRSPLGEYVLQGRYGKGRIATHLRPGVWLVKAVIARPDQDVVITSTKNMIRMTVEEVRQYKRDTLGNRLIKLAGEQMVVDVAVVDADVVADTE